MAEYQYQRAMREIMAPEAFATETWRMQQHRADRTGCHPKIIEFENKMIKEMQGRGVPMYCHTMLRDSAEQQRLYEDGHSNSPAGEGAHEYGMAADIVHTYNQWELSDKERLQKMAWAIIGHIGYEVAQRIGVKVQWGGDWDQPWDPAHWELRDWRQLAGR